MQNIARHKESGNIEELRKIENEAQQTFEYEVLEAVQKAIASIEEKTKQAETTSPGIEKRINEDGGSADVAESLTKEVDKEIEETKAGSEKQIEEVKGVNETAPINESVPGKEKQGQINSLIQELENSKNDEKQTMFKLGSVDTELKSKIGKFDVPFEEINTLPADKKEALMDWAIKQSPILIYKNPELLKQLTPGQLSMLDRSKNMLIYADAKSGADGLEMSRDTDSRASIENRSVAKVNEQPLPIQKTMYALKYAEMFSTKKSQLDNGVFGEKFFKLRTREDLTAAKTEFAKRMEDQGVLSLAGNFGGSNFLASLLKGEATQQLFFKEKSLFEQLKGSKNNLSEYVAKKDETNIKNLLNIYVDMKKEGLLSEEQFKELTTVF